METISALDDIPVVDLSNPNEDLVARAVVKASEEWGIFHVVNHWIPPELIGQLKEVGTEFFQLPESEKKALASEAKRLQEHGREVNEEYAKEIKKLSEKILGWLSEGLGLRREALKEGIGGETVEYLMKVVFYRPCQDQDVKYELRVILISVGSLFHKVKRIRMNNRKYERAERATLDKEKTRISWPVFVDPNLDHVVRPLPELISGDDNAPKFKPYTYRDYKFHIWNRLPLD
ncbi:hypothetical protein F2Q68_00019001 [Brassica cretica]|uniref:Non-haem dioxygenase N-terminal domain-containing protein n=1 Tax=Brassica cretica TaxID=69181 RepID=A0A8S9FX22_BRACR|nr:hypothetical protein F2Q68_00019001 [Brassica cretica]